MERSGAGTEQGAGLNYRNMLERGAAFSPLTLRSHVLVRGGSRRWTV